MAQDTRGALAVTQLDLWLSYVLYLPYEMHTKMATTVGERLEREVQLMESDAAARYRTTCARAPVCRNGAARHLVGWIALPALPALGLWLWNSLTFGDISFGGNSEEGTERTED